VGSRNPERVVQHIIDPIAGLIPANVDRVLKKMNLKSETSEKQKIIYVAFISSLKRMMQQAQTLILLY
jgi:succinyl-CoA synthetase beta subunit